MEALYNEAVKCTHGEEKAHVLLESIRVRISKIEDSRWIEYATTLTQRAVIDHQMRAVEVDRRIEAMDISDLPPFLSQAMVTLETLEANLATLCSSEDKGPMFLEAV